MPVDGADGGNLGQSSQRISRNLAEPAGRYDSRPARLAQFYALPSIA
jgi:hypothetical protein